MKKLIILLVILFIPFIVLAEECDTSKITITSLEQSKIEGNTEVVGNPTFRGRNINLNLKMYEVGDSITYNITINNTSEEDYMIDEDTFKTDSKYIEYSLSASDNSNVVKAKSNKNVTLTVTYKKEVEESLLSNNKFDATNSLNLSMNTAGEAKELGVITTDNIKELSAPKQVSNPITSVSSIKLIVIFFMFLLIIICLTVHNKKRYKKFIILVLSFILIPVVYAVCQADVKVESNIEIDKASRLFETIKKLSNEENACVTKYNGDVTDEVNKTVAATNVYFDKCSDKRNVIFGGFCWQVIRTTETGGIKMIYNGEPVDGKCESTRGEHKGIVGTHLLQEMAEEYSYGSSFTYDTKNSTFTLVDTFTEVWSETTYQELIGKFTCRNTTGTCTTLYSVNNFATATQAYVSSYTLDNTSFVQIGESSFNSYRYSLATVGYMYNNVNRGFSLAPGKNPVPSVVVYGDDIVDNGDDTYTLVNPKTINISDWPENHEDARNKYVCLNSTNSTCSDLGYIVDTGAGDTNYYRFYRKSRYIKIGTGFTYENGAYTLTNTVNHWYLSSQAAINDFATHHYTCWNKTGQCTKVYYVICQHPYETGQFLLDGGESMNDSLNEMLLSDNVNKYDSSIKGLIDNWYAQNLSSYTNMLEDTVYCNDRSVVSMGSLDESTSLNVDLNFKNASGSLDNSDLTCSNLTDQFSTSNNNAKLTYPVALVSGVEYYNLLKNSSLLTQNNEIQFWTSTPSHFNTYSSDSRSLKIDSSGVSQDNVGKSLGVRPTISLKTSTIIISGTGSEEDPWIIK